LTQKDAKKHNFYEEFDNKIKSLCSEISGKKISQYGMSCWHRWLAYAAQGLEVPFYVSDYDIINYNFNLNEPSNKLSLLDGCCPCIASGNSKQFEGLCYSFIEITKKNLEFIKQKTKHFHDQEFFIYNSKDFAKEHDAIIKRTRPQVGAFFSGEIQEGVQLYHVAHASTGRLKKLSGWEGLSPDQIRIKTMKIILENQKE